MNAEQRDALARYLLAMADDELVVGYRDTEWTGVGPMLEEDLAFSSIGLDEIGHARVYYSLLHELLGTQVDYRARSSHEYLHARYLERASAPRYDPSGAHQGGSDWLFALTRQFLYDLYDAERLQAAAGSAWAPLAQAVDKIAREEKYHLQHGLTWVRRLAEGAPEGRARLEQTLAHSWPQALGLFEPVAGEELLVAAGVLPRPSSELRACWLDRLAALLAPLRLPLPAVRVDGSWRGSDQPDYGGRRGEHGDDWQRLWQEITSVYRLDPAAVW